MKCPVCRSKDCVKVSVYRNESPILAGLDKVACNVCGLVFVDPMPSTADWDRYNSNYFESAHGGREGAKNAKLFRSGLAKIRAQHVRSYLQRHEVTVTTVLEIGPGFGEFVSAFKNGQEDLEYLALESDSNVFPALRAMGAKLISSFDDIKKPVDLVVVSHVLEHTTDPLGFLETCTKMLRPGGALFVEVPCMDFLYKESDEPHLQFFDKTSISPAITSVAPKHVELTYHGELRNVLQQKLERGRSMKLAARIAGRAGRLFAFSNNGLPAREWASVRPFNPAIIQEKPARWLRAIGIK